MKILLIILSILFTGCVGIKEPQITETFYILKHIDSTYLAGELKLRCMWFDEGYRVYYVQDIDPPCPYIIGKRIPTFTRR